MKKEILLLFLLFSIFSGASAQVDAEIAEECQDEYEPLISLAEINGTSGHIGHHSMYRDKVCVKGMVESRFSVDCDGTAAFFISGNETTTSHLSTIQGYRYGVCTGNVVTEVRENSCDPGEEPLLSVSDRINDIGRHVAGLYPDKRYENVLCAFYSPPENVTLRAEFNISSDDEVYFDDRQIDGDWSYEGLAEYPYLVSSSDSAVAGPVSPAFVEASRNISGENELYLQREAGSARYFVPFTRGSEHNIERRQQLVKNREFLNTYGPSFGFPLGADPQVRAIARQESNIDSNLSLGAGSHVIEIEKMKGNEVRITAE